MPQPNAAGRLPLWAIVFTARRISDSIRNTRARFLPLPRPQLWHPDVPDRATADMIRSIVCALRAGAAVRVARKGAVTALTTARAAGTALGAPVAPAGVWIAPAALRAFATAATKPARSAAAASKPKAKRTPKKAAKKAAKPKKAKAKKAAPKKAAKPKARKPKAKPKIDKSAPKRAGSSWAFFVKDNLAPGVPFKDAVPALSMKYRALSSSELEHYQKLALAARAQYETDLERYCRDKGGDAILKENQLRRKKIKEGVKSVKLIRDPLRPKRPLSAPLLFFQQMKHEGRLGSGPLAEQHRESKALYEALPAGERAAYEARTESARSAYRASMAQYAAKYGRKAATA
ncbi:uncharacterized protein V1510DRAFT_164221 [Dipodascopsis tothii]|uniref:uncharacterized protein n=1 Tax=Dipodascopsis tothii TaxID=44089 RepID=UPI0034CE29DC